MRAFFKEKKHGLIPKLNPALQLLQRREAACSVGWWLMAGAGLF
jgi:hypothetical protein